ncbi:transglutaminase TgpA family protein [Tundrisphaera sp. TA3]|uniref:transglutaminase TgpA family protein n=1 Tax=Tundrisphaera sp. TA3 TaxID=3435775 RepID=UPI003EC123E2
MTFSAIYRASFYLMLTFATLVMSVDATDDNKLAMLYPPAVALAGAIAFLTVDRNPKLALSRPLASALGLASTGLCFAEYQYDHNLLLLSAAHWLVYLQIIKIFLPKTVEDDWFLFLLGLVQVLVGGVISQSDKVGMALFCWALLSLWVLSLFALHRDALRMEKIPRPVDEDAPLGHFEIYRGLIDAPFFLASIRVAVTTLALAGLIFLAMPRRASMSLSRGGGTPGQTVSGFDEEVQLGVMGEILENDSVVLSIEMFDQDDRKIVPTADNESLWRGATMSRYERGRWRRQSSDAGGSDFGRPEREPGVKLIRQMIKMEPRDSNILFALRPIIEADSANRRSHPSVNMTDGTLHRMDHRPIPLEYEVTSGIDPNLPQPGETYPLPDYRNDLVSMPDDLRQRFRAIALKVVGSIPAKDVRGRADALERYLRDSGQFGYTLKQERGAADVDPVEDFLVRRKKGHCEYFASALTLLLRSIDIPARMINGFKGGDHNTLAGVLTVRQKHAHSWVEALVGRAAPDYQQPSWLTLDPTPADQRNESVAQVGGFASHFRQITDLIRYLWVFYVVGFNTERQYRLLYGPISRLISDAQRGFAIMGETIRSWLHFPSVGSFFSFRGFVVSFFALLLLVAFGKLVHWLVMRIVRWLSGPSRESANQGAGIAFYTRLLQLLAEAGLERPPAETSREFARRAAIFLSGHGSEAETVADVPPLVVDAFYRIRFGDHRLAAADLGHLDARLDALEAHIRPSRA